MGKRHLIQDILEESADKVINNFTVDCVLLAFHEGRLKVLLNKYKVFDWWKLIGGVVRVNEDVDTAMQVILRYKTGMDKMYLKQFQLFGSSTRLKDDNRGEILKMLGLELDENHWFLKRFISMGYYALVKYADVNISYADDIEDVQWFNIDELPEMYGDHSDMIDRAIKTIRLQIGVVPLGYQLLPEKFTMPEIRMVYEAILGEELDRRNFQRKMMSVGLMYRLNEKRKSGAHKAPYLYAFNVEKFKELEGKDVQLMPWTHGEM